jgi:hypothetical protein
MSKVVFKNKEKVVHVEQATVQDVIDMMEAKYLQARKQLVDDLKFAGASETALVKGLTELRENRGITALLLRDAFTLDGAKHIVEHMAKPEDHESIFSAKPNEVVDLALQILGYEYDTEEKVEDDPDPT